MSQSHHRHNESESWLFDLDASCGPQNSETQSPPPRSIDHLPPAKFKFNAIFTERNRDSSDSSVTSPPLTVIKKPKKKNYQTSSSSPNDENSLPATQPQPPAPPIIRLFDEFDDVSDVHDDEEAAQHKTPLNFNQSINQAQNTSGQGQADRSEDASDAFEQFLKLHRSPKKKMNMTAAVDESVGSSFIVSDSHLSYQSSLAGQSAMSDLNMNQPISEQHSVHHDRSDQSPSLFARVNQKHEQIQQSQKRLQSKRLSSPLDAAYLSEEDYNQDLEVFHENEPVDDWMSNDESINNINESIIDRADVADRSINQLLSTTIDRLRVFDISADLDTDKGQTEHKSKTSSSSTSTRKLSTPKIRRKSPKLFDVDENGCMSGKSRMYRSKGRMNTYKSPIKAPTTSKSRTSDSGSDWEDENDIDNGATAGSSGADQTFLRCLNTSQVSKHSLGTSQFGKTHFKKNKTKLVERLFAIYNEHVFEYKIPPSTPIVWNSRLRKTAGQCVMRRQLGERLCRIELSTKVCDSADRVRDTLMHELCHAAVWIVSGESGGHGPLWRYWAQLANQKYPELPVVGRCHSYEIKAKYVYKCQRCDQTIKRHSKSLDIERKACGICHGKFILMVRQKTTNNQNLNQTKLTPAKDVPKRAPNKFALFVKEHYQNVKTEMKGASHKEVMGKLSEMFKGN